MNNIIMFPTNKRINSTPVINQSVVPTNKPLTANDPDLMIKLLHEMQAEKVKSRIKGEKRMNINQVIVSGRLASDPVLRHTDGDNSVPTCSFVLIVDRPGGDDKKDFPTVITWRNVAEFAAKNLSKGRKVIIHGELRTHNYTNKDGKKRKATEIQADYIEIADNKPGKNGR